MERYYQMEEDSNHPMYLYGASSSFGGPQNRLDSEGMNLRIAQLVDSPMLEDSDTSGNFKVVVRVRPPLERELAGPKPFSCCTLVDGDRSITISENPACLDGSGDVYDGLYNTHRFTFDHVYDQDSRQTEVYENTAKAVVASTLQGYNATIIAYGQTGTGKTYTMEGFTNQPESRGIIPHSTEDIFSYIQHSSNAKNKFLVRTSYLQIYNESISDLLKPERKNLQIREDKKKGVFVEDLSEWVVRSPAEIYTLMERGAQVRATGATKMNEMSSRSHAIFLIIVEQSETVVPDDEDAETAELEAEMAQHRSSPQARGSHAGMPDLQQRFKIGKLNLVDLAGSERVRYTGATGVRLEESKKINQSLSALGNVIAALTDQKSRVHIPYRDAKLTRILADSLGGNCKTTMMAMISPALEAFHESLSTLKFANRAKNIKNEARINEDLDQRALLRKYERELKKLRSELQMKNQEVVDKRKLLELEEDRRRAEEDKLAAITALEQRSREFMREKEEKRKLEIKIAALEGQLLVGGVSEIEDTPQFRNALQAEYQKVHQAYENKLADLERERQTIEEDKLQVDRYKQLLLKQRDIMIALTARLNERDETILALQEELDAYDRQQRILEDALDAKTATLIHLQRVAMEANATSPVKNSQLERALGLVAAEQEREWLNLPRQPSFQEDLASATEVVKASAIAAAASSAAAYGSQAHRATPILGYDDGPMLSNKPVLGEDFARALEDSRLESSQLAQELEEVKAEKVSLEYLLRERLEGMVHDEIDSRIETFRRQVGGRLEANASRMRDVGDAVVASIINFSAVEKMQSRISELEALASEREEQRAAAEYQLLQLQRQLHSQSALVSSQDSSDSALNAFSASSSSGLTSGSRDRVSSLEERLSILNQQHTKFREEVAARLEEKNRVIAEYADENKRLKDFASSSSSASLKNGSDNRSLSEFERQVESLQRKLASEEDTWKSEREKYVSETLSLKQQCAINAKERQALRVILESKIKGMVDHLCVALSSSGTVTDGSSVYPADPSRLLREASALQNLVNASVQAMRSSEER